MAAPRSVLRAIPRMALAVTAASMLALATAGGASAHGDPSTHSLEGDVLYPAIADRPTPATELRLLTLLLAARDAGFPIKVSLIANEADLTEDPAMLDQPQAYAEELANVLDGASALPGAVLVVSPAGYGLAGNTTVDGAVQPLRPENAAAMRDALPSPQVTDGEGLAQEAEVAVRALAALAGHVLPTDVPSVAAMDAPAAAVGAGVAAPTVATDAFAAAEPVAPEVHRVDLRVPLTTFLVVFLAALAGKGIIDRRRRTSPEPSVRSID